MMVLLCYIPRGLDSDQINFCYLYCKIFLSCCFAFTVCMFFFPRSSCENWIDNNETPPVNFPHRVSFVLVHSMHVVLLSRQLHMIMLSMRRLGWAILSVPRSSHMVFPLYETTLCLKVKCDNSFNFPRLKSKKNCKCAISIFFWWQELAFSVIQPIENDFWYERRLKMYIKWCQQHPRGQSRVPVESESGCCAQRLDTPLSGGSVMALSFSRHVPGSFDTGNMHAGWQCLGCAAETMMYISFSLLTDWRL